MTDLSLAKTVPWGGFANMVEVVMQGGAGKCETPASASPLPRDTGILTSAQTISSASPLAGVNDSMNCSLPLAQMAASQLWLEVGLS